MRFAWILALGVALAGCRASDSPITRAAGSWQGQFQIDAVDGKADAASIKSEELDANLELYVTGDKFELDATARHQKFSVIGKWTAAPGGRITMTADSYTFDNPTDEDQRALGLRLISPDQVRATFGHAFVLDESPDRRRLTGLVVTLGRLEGRFEFSRPIPK
ncbi:MAG TPA: hypothetical protein VMI31_03280 [Fimbriimonadaceae bacterium]|nr:hypothetical protein [Fimbriimonadaceae bacterium]